MTPPLFSHTDLALLQTQLKAWRQRQAGRRRLPPELWEAAAHLARSHGISLVARVLRLDFYRLQRLSSEPQPPVPRVPASTPFIELKLDPPPSDLPAAGWVELIDGPHRRMRLHTGRDPATWIALARSFWRRKP